MPSHLTKIPADTMLAHCTAARAFYMPHAFRGRKAPIKRASAALAFAVLSSRDSSVTPKERMEKAALLVSLSCRFAVRLSGEMMGMRDVHEVIIGSSSRECGQLGDTSATCRPSGPSGIFFLDRRTKRVEDWQFSRRPDGVEIARVTIDEQRV